MAHFNPPEGDEPARGGQGFDSPPLGALRKFPIDTPSACGGVVNYLNANSQGEWRLSVALAFPLAALTVEGQRCASR